MTQQVANPQGSGKCVKSSKKSFWKPSKHDALEGIIVHVKVGLSFVLYYQIYNYDN